MADNNDAQEVITLCGIVKWFDPGKGFGFVISDEGGADILLHANVLRNFGQSSVADGSSIKIEVQATERGRQAVTVLEISPPETDQSSYLNEFTEGLVDPTDIGPLVPARVKWFDKAKGFGFANVFGSDEDVFIHVEVLRRCGLADVQAGEAVALYAANGSRGSMAVTISSWDSASKTDSGTGSTKKDSSATESANTQSA